MLPTKSQVIDIFARHQAVQFRRPVCRAFVIGSFARGEQRPDSDLDILFEIAPVGAFYEDEVTDAIRTRIENAPKNKRPMWNGRPLDLYVTYDADADSRPKIEIL
jgi:predicted nucleotidyltransferase